MIKIKIFLLSLFTFCFSFGQTKNFIEQEIINAGDSIRYFQIKTDTLFDSKQIISFLVFPQKAFENYKIEVVYNRKELEKTSSFGMRYDALAAVNGSFFDMDSGGGVAYLEVNDTVINKTKSTLVKWAVPDSLINGAFVLTNKGEIVLQLVETDSFYEQSKMEDAVMVSGPMLLLNTNRVKLPQMDFAFKRHPRTFVCTYNGSLIFILVDGRSSESEGFTLVEAQEFLQGLNIKDAINFDGGGSTTMWLKNVGVVNNPSDKTGERPVANALLILKK